ncbi:50S ribosomal protein L30 [Deinococcus misasensis]|uniref:50S ribosomal protein L30 n=1 Tax=Deinococcus misasensis TaxID=392413 RepID=UPI0005549629|nr:50S ribosomal protein L30 [Deinococcus misasensis]
MKIKLVRSTIGRPGDQVATVKALGLKKIGDEREVPNTDAVKGMVNKVKFLLEVQE